MSENELAEVSRLLTACNLRHQETMQEEWERHLKFVKKAINIRVGLPVGILCTLLIAVLTTVYNNGVKVAENQTKIIQTVANQKSVEKDIDDLDKKLDANFKWLIENARTNNANAGRN